ncbi:MAG: TetR/AcrR family transcriptional regulator [Clostridiales bacterium]|nr:TetR/AcrR family transcriptional regulator [Clostridiales bacterium]
MKRIEDFYNESPTKTHTRHLIINTSVELFSESGMDAVSMVEIAKACKITTRNLYRYYPNKEMLVVDTAYHVITMSEHLDDITVNAEDSGYECVRKIIENIYKEDENLTLNFGIAKFIMYFDLYISKMDKSHPAFVLYTTRYVKAMNLPIKTKLYSALKKGIEDGSITIPISEIELYEEYIIQSLLSILLRVKIKEVENESINSSLVEKHIEVMLKYISSK